MSLSKISYVILFVRQPETSAAWYRDVLGCTVKSSTPEWVEIDGGGVTLALHEIGPGAPDMRPGGTEVVFGVPDIHAAHATLRERGVTFVQEPRVVCEVPGGVGMSGVFKDPDGHLLSIFGIVRKPG
jgi:catechol 2,3-dioxygenase-like lactoylglutathione lyase family enzyme